jgi:hypothetical protein
MDEREELAALRRLAELEAKAAAADPGPDPAAGMSAIERGLVGTGAAMRKAYLGVRNLVPGVNLSDDERDELARYERYRDNLGTAGKVGEVVGDVALTAIPGGAAARGLRLAGGVLTKAVPRLAGRVAGSLGRNVVTPAASGALVSAATAPEDRGGAALGGAVGGVVGEGVGRVLTRTLGGISGATRAARDLIAQGIDVPLWKATDNSLVRYTGEIVGALPLTRNLMRRAEGRAGGQWNEQLVREASPPVPVRDEAGNVLRWEKQPVQQAGHAGLQELRERFNDAYGALYEGRTIPVDDAFAQQLDSIAQQTSAYLPGIAPDVLGRIRRVNDTLRAGTETTVTRSPILDASGRPIVSEQLGHAGVSSAHFKRALDDIDESVTSAWRQGDAERATALEAVRDAVEQLRLRGLPPQVSSALEPIQAAYARYKTLQRAASSVGAMKQGGMVTPAQMVNAIKARDRTVNKRASAEGTAPGQQQALQAQEVLGSYLPSVGPGTAEKLAPLLGLAGVGLPFMGMDAGAALLLATPQGQRALRGDYRLQGAVRSQAERIADLMRAYGADRGKDDDKD